MSKNFSNDNGANTGTNFTANWADQAYNRANFIANWADQAYNRANFIANWC